MLYSNSNSCAVVHCSQVRHGGFERSQLLLESVHPESRCFLVAQTKYKFITTSDRLRTTGAAPNRASGGKTTMAQRPMTSFIERQVNHICGRWLDGFTKENVEVSLMQANITLSNVLLKTVSWSVVSVRGSARSTERCTTLRSIHNAIGLQVQ